MLRVPAQIVQRRVGGLPEFVRVAGARLDRAQISREALVGNASNQRIGLTQTMLDFLASGVVEHRAGGSMLVRELHDLIHEFCATMRFAGPSFPELVEFLEWIGFTVVPADDGDRVSGLARAGRRDDRVA